MKNGFIKAWLLVLVVIVMVLGARYVIAETNFSAPTLKDILLSAGTGNRFDLSFLVVGVLAFAFATLSMAKGYEIVRRTRQSLLVEEAKPEDLDIIYQEKKIEDELKNKFEAEVSLLQETISELKNALNRIQLDYCEQKGLQVKAEQELIEIKKMETALRKSNIALAKDCERLRGENELLHVKVGELSKIKEPQQTAGKKTKPAKAKKVAAVKTLKKITQQAGRKDKK